MYNWVSFTTIMMIVVITSVNSWFTSKLSHIRTEVIGCSSNFGDIYIMACIVILALTLAGWMLHKTLKSFKEME